MSCGARPRARGAVLLAMSACGGTVIVTPGDSGGGGSGGATTASAGRQTASSAQTGSTTAGLGGGAGGEDALGAACARFCQLYGSRCATFDGDCQEDCRTIAEDLGCEEVWIAMLSCLGEKDVSCDDVSLCADDIYRWNVCIDG